MHKNDILNIGAPAAFDDSITKKDFYTYTPYTNSLGESEEIRILIQNQDACLLPSESYLYIQFSAIATNYSDSTTDENRIHFTHNWPSFLFSDARYELNGIEVDRIRNVGITSTMKLSAASCPSNTTGYYHFNETFTGKSAEHKTNIVYDVMIPLSIWFGFCDDYRKVILNSRHELILNRARSSLNCLCGGLDTAGSTEVKIKISKLEWKMPHVTLADNVKSNMKSSLAKNKSLPIQHRTWDLYEYPQLPETANHIWSVKTVSHLNKPRYVLVGFQQAKNEVKTANASKFNSLNISSVRLHMNSNVYPYHMHDVDIPNAKFAELYQAYSNIQTSYYNGSDCKNLFALDYKDFQSDVMFAFDTSRSDESIKHGSIDIRLEIKASRNLPAKTTAFCLIIYENEFTYSPLDGIVTRCV